MFNNILRPFGFQRRNQNYARNAGGGLAIPILGYLAYRYREPIGRFLRDKLGKLQQSARDVASTTTPMQPPPIPKPF